MMLLGAVVLLESRKTELVAGVISFIKFFA